MKTDLNKSSAEWLAMPQDAKLSVRVVYEKVMVKSLIMSGSTEQAHWIVYGHVLQVAVQIVNVSLHGNK